MWLRDKDKPALAKFFLNASIVSVILALIGALGTDLYLASTQWMLVSIILAIWGVFYMVEAHFRLR